MIKSHASMLRIAGEPPLALALWSLSLLASLGWAAIVVAGLLPGSAPAAPSIAGVTAPAPHPLAWHAAQLALMFLAWAGLCTALMLPLASRAAVLFAHLAGERAALRARSRTGLFVLGYLGSWTGIALLAAIVHWLLHAAGPAGLYPSTLRHPALLGLTLALAGIYQWTPTKHACLAHCRAPLTGILAGWRDGPAGALGRGVSHARQCLGCCWPLMLVLLAAGPDNPAAVTAVGLLVLAEMRLAAGHWMASISGPMLLGLGTALLFP